ncbi:MAG TPA: SDR family NAD(P)-dependent oxidoreductase [Candidatus Paceibacterota bacterium]|nr:SDR family NAD(P)-dependent oxidoreductase [Verrucomicrobiota bacterium]HRZ46678.1 SDR family NAD(P)-dependent oxidoreductase [Candidatus Paceibacterota bacterium]
MQERLANRWVLITGASSGFGAAAARAFGAAGARLLLGARRVSKLAEAAEAARRAGSPAAEHASLDVASAASVEEYVRWARGRTDGIDVLVNNAGGALGLEPVAEGRDQDWETMIQTNVLGLLRVTRAVLPLMRGQPGAMILNVGSVAGRTAYENGAVYCGAKAAELQITRALRLELCGTGIRVGTLDPGMAETEFSLVRFKGDAQRAERVYEGVDPLRAEDVAEAMVWMASRPPHVCIDEMVIKCTDQAAVYKVHRRPRPPGKD